MNPLSTEHVLWKMIQPTITSVTLTVTGGESDGPRSDRVMTFHPLQYISTYISILGSYILNESCDL